MNLIELNAIKGHLQKQMVQINAIPVNCHSCIKFAFGECQEFKAVPPADWVNAKCVDCQSWDWDGVPF
jgi:hypothetical protein